MDCHSGDKPRGGLDLSRRRTALVPGKPEESLLWQYVRDGKVPPKKPLADAEKALLRVWVAAGVPWGEGLVDPFRCGRGKPQ